ncbi:hypothetical protein Ddye_015423 [Dipteronia dyeriana]|uniref:non-specific serine/threonine protein kinase n=1 Tax=Dipteronia dyeriana TaxID=168575 RepID=A0AAD9U5F4_9ROSI|nr:hypothetical protein Ddye_015423 [Dipteronia dyeriana]
MTCTARIKTSLFPWLVQLYSIITFISILISLPASSCKDDHEPPHIACTRPYGCGTSTWGIWYPFWGVGRPAYCGHEGFELKCRNNQYPLIESGAQKFRVSNIDVYSATMSMVRDDLWDGYCPGILQETNFNKNRIKYMSNVVFLDLFYDCSDEISLKGRSNSINCREGTGFYTSSLYLLQLPNVTSTCEKRIQVPVLRTALQDHIQKKSDFQQSLNKGFGVEFKAVMTPCSQCFYSRGICASNTSNSKFVCFCRGQPHTSTCDSSDGFNLDMILKVIIGVTIAIGLGITATRVIIWLFRSKMSSIISRLSFKKRRDNVQDLEDFIRNYGPLAIKRYSFSNVKKMTNSFKEKLGQGGYGGVYKGKLLDGQLVAVKLLNTSKGNGQEFINEVSSISKTSHVNVVTLFGFCLEGSKRALIYEFMPNGSLEKFSYDEGSLKTSHHLGWDKRYEIALGIARGLEYLHRGCNTRILHLDIKPHNILLDEDFCPKISDFGLAKLCPKKESIVSMFEARGTIGYIAPEIFIRNLGDVSHKSDVFSYGMMVLEMVGGRKKPHLGVDSKSDVYFPEWIYRNFELGEDIKLHGATSSEENEIAKKMIIVGLWCIQTRPMDRPSMNEILDMLQGSIEALHVPPSPCLFSPSVVQHQQ